MTSDEESPNLDLKTRRLEIWLKFWRVIFVSGVFAVIGIVVPPWISSQIQTKELEIAKTQKQAELDMEKNRTNADIEAKRLAQEQQYVNSFLEAATEQNVENRYRFTRYLSALTLNPQLKNGWTQLFEEAQSERAMKQERLEALKGGSTEEAKAEIARLKSELEIKKNPPWTGTVVVTAPLAKITESLESLNCPPRTTPVISAFEIPLGPEESPKSDMVRTFNLGVWCSGPDNLDRNPNVYLYDRNGKIITSISYREVFASGLGSIFAGRPVRRGEISIQNGEMNVDLRPNIPNLPPK